MSTPLNSAPRTNVLRMSTREMLILVAFVALAIVSLKHASTTWLAWVAALTAIVTIAGSIVSVVDRGPRQASAIGFVFPLFGYLLLVFISPRIELNADFARGRLPTTLALNWAYRSVREARWIDPDTGQPISELEAQSQRSLLSGPFAAGPRGPYLENVPKQADFIVIGHCWWALVLGYAGSRFAAHVYRRRQADGAL